MMNMILRRIITVFVFGGLPGMLAMILADPSQWMQGIPFAWIPIVTSLLAAIEKYLREKK